MLSTAAATQHLPDGTGVDREAARRAVFLYQDGVLLSSTVRALSTLGLLDPAVWPDRPDNGYLRVAWRALDAVGWVDESAREWTDEGRAALRHRERYLAAGRFLSRFADNAPDSWDRPWGADTEEAFAELLDAHERWRSDVDPSSVITAHLDGALAVPALLSLRGTGRLQRPRDAVAALLSLLGWLDGNGSWTPLGHAGLALVDHMGMVGSYLPMLARLEQLCRGELVVEPGADEWHCQRRLNVQASAAAHRRYFADADPVFAEIFSRTPRPAFIADMGCGDGSWLAHLHDLLGDSIRYVGIDASQVALDHAREVLQAAGVCDPLLLQGDIGSPDALREQLAAHGLAIEDGLHIRSFLDHDRRYLGGEPSVGVPGWSTGAAYVAPDGRPLGAAEVESDLVEHLRRWVPHVRKHGLVVLEAHCVAPSVTRRHLGALHSVAFDAYHGLSHQYPVEHSAYLRCCRLAGLQSVSHLERRYPTTRPFVAVSLHRLTPVRPAPRCVPTERLDTWRPGPGIDRSDGEDLHRLLFHEGDVAHPRQWCSGATGIVVRDALHAIEARIESARPGDTVRVLDYGAGTGLASIELIKGCVAHDIEQRLADCGATFELHLVDIPTSWFAKGYELLGEHPWTRFHALRDGSGFRPLIEVMAGEQVDVVLANMVFHLLTPGAMRHAAESIARVLRPGGVLSFSSPDLGPAGGYSVLFHDPNRLLRRHWLTMLDSADEDSLAPALREAVKGVRPAERASAQRRAERRILPTPQTRTSVAAALARDFRGAVERCAYELLAEESLMTALVPANQSEYLAEIDDRCLREAVIDHLMREQVLPELMRGPAGTAFGLNVEWTTGRYERCR